jgi:hypothetical protein
MHLMIQGIRPIPTCLSLVIPGTCGHKPDSNGYSVALADRTARVVGTDGEAMPQNQLRYMYIANELRTKIKDRQLKPKREAAHRGRVERAARGLWSRQTSFYLMDFITKGANKLLMAQDIEEGSVRYLDNEIGVRQTGYRDWITGRLATEEEQTCFGIGHNAAVFVDSRVAFDQNNIPMRLTVTIFPVDRNQLIVIVGPNVPT